MRKNINTPNVNKPFDIVDRILNISNQNIHNLIYSSMFHWDEESITTAYLGSIYGQHYSIDGRCIQCGNSFVKCPNGSTPPLKTRARIASFSRYQESEYSGSDFLLSFPGHGKSQVKVLIQAKVILGNQKLNSVTWKKILHKNGEQYKKLKLFSKDYSARPYYLFYVLHDSPHSLIATACKKHMTPYDTFAVIIPADEICRIYNSKKSWHNSKITFNQLIAPKTFPLACLISRCIQLPSVSNFDIDNPCELLYVGKDLGHFCDDFDAKSEDVSIPEFAIESNLVKASGVKEYSMSKDFSLELYQDSNLIAGPPDVASINYILNLLNGDEFTTFGDIADCFEEGNKQSRTMHVVTKILSSSVLPEDAAKVVGAGKIEESCAGGGGEGFISLQGSFKSYFGYKSRVEVLREFYPYLKIVDEKIMIGDGVGGAKLLHADDIISRLGERFFE